MLPGGTCRGTGGGGRYVQGTSRVHAAGAAPTPRLHDSADPRLRRSADPRIRRSADPRVRGSVRSRLHGATAPAAPRFRGSAGPRDRGIAAPRFREVATPRLHSSAVPRSHGATAPRLHGSADPRLRRAAAGYRSCGAWRRGVGTVARGVPCDPYSLPHDRADRARTVRACLDSRGETGHGRRTIPGDRPPAVIMFSTGRRARLPCRNRPERTAPPQERRAGGQRAPAGTGRSPAPGRAWCH